MLGSRNKAFSAYKEAVQVMHMRLPLQKPPVVPLTNQKLAFEDTHSTIGGPEWYYTPIEEEAHYLFS